MQSKSKSPESLYMCVYLYVFVAYQADSNFCGDANDLYEKKNFNICYTKYENHSKVTVINTVSDWYEIYKHFNQSAQELTDLGT